MKNRKLAAVGLLLATGLGACDMDDLTAVNENPNNPTTAPAPAVFTNAARLAVTRWFGGVNYGEYELVAQHLAEVQYPETDQYRRLSASFTSATFDATYYSELKDFAEVVEAGLELEAPGYWAPAAVMQSLVFGYVTDTWGDVPYSSALLGDSVGVEDAFQPAYDPQQEIYAGLFETLDQAATGLAGAPANGLSLGGADPIYGGDFLAWQRFANSLRARHALRIVNVDPARADAELRAAFNAPGGTFQSNADNAVFDWPGDGVYDNPLATNLKTRDDFRVSDRLMGFLLGWDDPRTGVYAMPTEADPSVYGGLPNALSHAEASTYFATSSRPGEVFYPGTTSYGTFGGDGASFPSQLMTYAEVAFIKAEAAERGLGGLSASQARGFYEEGIRASMQQWGVTDAAAIAAYLAQPEVAYQGGTAGLEQIATQKWIAFYMDGLQAWSEWRRTCQPAVVKPGPEAILSTIPRRYFYSTTEDAVNSASLSAAVARQGADEFTTRIWWDSAPTAAPTYEAGCGQR